MNYGIDYEQIGSDFRAIGEFFFGFTKSFGPSQKKVQDRPIGFFEEMHIRFRLHLVEMGISNIIRTGILLIVGIITFFTVFLHADVDLRWAIGFVFLVYAIWLFMPHIEEIKKKGGIFSEFLSIIYEWTTEPFITKKEEKKK